MNTQMRYHQRRLADVAAALRLARTQTSREHGPRARLAQHQQQRLDIVVRHAATHSRFYRRRLAATGAVGDERRREQLDADLADHGRCGVEQLVDAMRRSTLHRRRAERRAVVAHA